MKPSPMKLFIVIFSTFALLLTASTFQAATVDQAATISIPEAVLLQTIKDGLPIPIEAHNQYVQGDVIIKSLEKLEVRDKSVFLQGVVFGRNFTVQTTIAGKEISMDLGSVQLPVSCELFLRFDGKNKVLFLTPHFPKPKSLYTTDPGDALLLLLSSLGEKEYPVELDAMQPVLAKVGTRNIPIRLEPVDIKTQKGLLLIKMRPRVEKDS